jgi:hypothetical protein
MTVKRKTKKGLDLKGAAVKYLNGLGGFLDVVGRVSRAAGGAAHAFDQNAIGRLANGVGQDLLNAGTSLGMAAKLVSGALVNATPEDGPEDAVIEAEEVKRKPRKKAED